ncbi:MAG TPA: 4-alpha-glucanotransferase, partial [Gammaproteobacteria bacterium]|nr:4-alpha-glucanotransferase [Gammaproteobacteria bacterium]
MKFEKRKAGVLLHPSSLPGGKQNGEFGAEAYEFIDFIADCGFKVWQVLPMGPTHDDNSPYQCLSAHAGDVRFIAISELLKAPWVNVNEFHVFQQAAFSGGESIQTACLQYLLAQFDEYAEHEQRQQFAEFQSKQAFWLRDFSLFSVLRKKYVDQSWVAWPAALRDREPDALEQACQAFSVEMRLIAFEQFIFFRQWLAIKQYANQRGVELFGDIPLFVAHDSSDVWANRKFFKLDAEGRSTVIAGVPPDYFSETGQRWGNPLYDWQAIAEDGYQWWVQRLATQFELFDLLRIDHFRGLQAYWEIPAEHETAVNGYWVDGPGDAFFEAIEKYFGEQLPLVAEDLGFITEEVHQLRENAALPGMKILQFAFDSDAMNPYLPHNHEMQSVVYTGTHDNDTSLGWYQGTTEDVKKRVREYYADASENMPWLLIRSAFASVSGMAIVPMQDLMALGSEHRMNVPGTTEGNWCWRFTWSEVDKSKIKDKVR